MTTSAVQSFLWMDCPHCHQQVRYRADTKQWRSERSGTSCQWTENGTLMGPGHGVHIESARGSARIVGGGGGSVEALAS